MTGKDPRGGPDRGQGRNPLVPDDPTERHTVTAPGSVWRLIESLGRNRSEGLRRLAEAYENQKAGE